MRRSAWSSLVAVVIAGAVALSACGSGSSAPTTSTTDPGGGGSHAKASFAAYSACLKAHGVKLPTFNGGPPNGSFPPSGSFPTSGSTPPGGGGRGRFNSPAFRKAAAACASLRPTGSGNRPGGRNFSSAAFAAYRNCLKLHGVTLPTRPTSSNSTPPTTFNSTSPKVKKALAACAGLRPKFTPRSSGSTTTTTLS